MSEQDAVVALTPEAVEANRRYIERQREKAYRALDKASPSAFDDPNVRDAFEFLKVAVAEQSEPSDAQVEAAARAILPDDLFPWETAAPAWQDYARRRAAAALRAASEAGGEGP